MAGIYIHIEAPRSLASGSSSLVRSGISYTNALVDELCYYAPTLGTNETIEAIHFGGSPDYIGEEGIRALVGALFAHYDATYAQELSIEIHPGSYNQAEFYGLAALGFNKLHINAGSFFESDLAALNREYTPEDIQKTIYLARNAGFDRFSIDLNVDIDDQPEEYWGANLEKSLGLGIQHISLTGMPVFNLDTRPPQLAACFSYPLSDSAQSDRYAFATAFLTQAGFENYVIPSFALPECYNHQCMLQVMHSNILGIGPGAHSFWWHGSSNSQANRWTNVDNIEQYKALLTQQELPLDTRSRLTLDMLADEHILLRIQHIDGLDLTRLETEYGVDLLTDEIDKLAWLESERYIEPIRNHRVKLSDYGKVHCEDVFSQLLSH